jgi:linker histone H1 and H5 family
MSSPARATEAVAAEKPKSTKGRAASKKDAPKEAKEPAAPAPKEKKEKKAFEEKAEEDDEDDADGEKRTAAKKRKAGGHSGSRDHPSFEEIIRECIRESKEDRREGVSRPTIKSAFRSFTHVFSPPCRCCPPWVRGGEGWQRFSTSGGANAPVDAEFMESRYGLEMTSLTIANINRAILKGQEKGVFELPKGPSGKVKLAKAAEDKEVRRSPSGLSYVSPDSCVSVSGFLGSLPRD